MKRMLQGDRVNNLDIIGQGINEPNVDPNAVRSAYDQLKSLRTEDDYESGLRQKLMDLVLRQKNKQNIPLE